MNIEAGAVAIVLPLLAFALLTAGNAFFVAAEFAPGHRRPGGDRPAGRRRATGAPARSARPCGSCPSSSPAPSSASPSPRCSPATWPSRRWPSCSSPLLRPLGRRHRTRSRTCLALVLATLISMLFGELVPKNAALARPMPAALAHRRPDADLLRGLRLADPGAQRLGELAGPPARRRAAGGAGQRPLARGAGPARRDLGPGRRAARPRPRCCCGARSGSARSGRPRR